jgi:predicted permease
VLHRQDDPRRSIRSILGRRHVSDEVDEELDFHIEMRSRELAARGLEPAAAREAAIRRFGDLDRVMATCRTLGERTERGMRRTEWFDGLRQDVVWSIRQLRGAPGFATIAVLTLALGIGATSAIFSAVDAVVLRPLPYPAVDRVMVVSTRVADVDQPAAAGNYLAWRARSRSFERLAAVEYTNATLLEGTDAAEQVTNARVSADYFPLFGMRPQMGRVFGPDEDIPGRDGVVVLSHRLWVRRFHSDPHILGRSLRLNGQAELVIGVMPEVYDLPTRGGEDIWMPLALTPEQRNDFRKGYLAVYGRLRDGVTRERADTEMRALAASLEKEYPDLNRQRSAHVESFESNYVGDAGRRLFTMFGAVALVLAIACGNVANLLLARGAGRARELAIRAALGAGRGRVVRQLLTEALVLGLAGGLAGTVVARAGIRLLIAQQGNGLPRLEAAGLNGAVLAFVLATSVVSALLFGAIPALRIASPNLVASLREGGRGTASGTPRERLRTVLVTGEVALSLVLLAGAGLLIRSALQLQRVAPGFDPHQVFTGWITLPAAEYGATEHVVQTYSQLALGAARLPGVKSAVVSSLVPFFSGAARGGFRPEGSPEDGSGAVVANFRIVSPGYLATMRIDLHRGRDLTAQDIAGSPPVVVLSEAAARAAWHGQDPIGRRIGFGRTPDGKPVWREVVGIAADTREDGLNAEALPALYLPMAQTPPQLWDAMQRSMFVIARTDGDPALLEQPMRRLVQQVAPTAPLFDVRSMEARLAGSLAAMRFSTILLSVLGVAGVVLAAVGIYGVIAYFVGQRTQEIGLRMALGATPARVQALVIGHGLRPVMAGVVFGVGAALGTTRVLAAMLFGVEPTDAVTLVAVSLLIVAVALLASVVPARRALRVDPARVLQ